MKISILSIIFTSKLGKTLSDSKIEKNGYSVFDVT